MRELYEQICAGEELRAALIELKRRLKEEENVERFREASGGNCDVIMKCLVDPDPKVRKNAAGILGELKAQEAVDVLMDGYREEETLYIRPDYVNALAALDCSEYLAELHGRLDYLAAYEAPENEKKHVRAETAALRKLILEKEGISKHVFTGYNRTNEVLLTTLPAFLGILEEGMPFQKAVNPEGIAVSAGDLRVVLENRYWQEMLFFIHGAAGDAKISEGTLKGIDASPEAVAGELARSDLMTILRENHRGTDPFYFRVGVTGPLPRDEKSLMARQTGLAIEEVFGGILINSASHYEAEIRIAADGEGRVTPYLKLFTVPDRRFSYRRYHVAAGMKPYVAAGLTGLAKPYLRDGAQVLDPFCGVGTLLIERRFAGPVRSAYGTDIFGEAVEKARRNAQIAQMPVNYINRDFFDFTHDYLFDEILTDLPDRIGDREETEAFFAGFLERSAGLLAEHGRIFCYTGERGMLKKHLRLNGRFRLIREFLILERSGSTLFILERRD